MNSIRLALRLGWIHLSLWLLLVAATSDWGASTPASVIWVRQDPPQTNSEILWPKDHRFLSLDPYSGASYTLAPEGIIFRVVWSEPPPVVVSTGSLDYVMHVLVTGPELLGKDDPYSVPPSLRAYWYQSAYLIYPFTDPVKEGYQMLDRRPPGFPQLFAFQLGLTNAPDYTSTHWDFSRIPTFYEDWGFYLKIEAMGWGESHAVELQWNYLRLNEQDLLKLDDAAPHSLELPAGGDIPFQASVISLLQSAASADLILRVADPQGVLVAESPPLRVLSGSGLATNVLVTPAVQVSANWTHLNLRAVFVNPASGQVITNTAVRACQVVAPPTPYARLTVTRNSSTTVTILWPGEAIGYALESCTGLDFDADWGPFPGVPNPLTGPGSVEVPTSSQALFFRFRK